MSVSTQTRTAAANTAFVGRQPIFLPNLEVFGYELLFREGNFNSATITDGDYATASVVLNSLTDVGLDVLTESKHAFINLTRSLLLNADLSCLPPKLMVLEVLEDIEPDVDVLAAMSRLAADGYTVALDDFIYCPELEPLVQLADIVKIEFPQIPQEDLAEHIAKLRELGARTILAEKLETQEQFELCKRLGCDLFQGYFFCRPQVVNRKRLQTNVSSVVSLMTKMQDPTITTASVAELIHTDPNLTYKVLRFVNSANSATDTEIESLEHAITLLGLRRLRSLVSMMLLASIDDGKPEELAKTAMIRAKMCELLAKQSGYEGPGRYFTLGLLSVMDAMLDLPMEDVIRLLPLSRDMNDALLHRHGQLGNVLARVVEFQTGEKFSVENVDVTAAYLETLQWTSEFGQTV